MAGRKKIPVQDLPEVRRDESLDDILVFGYSCKIFRDDERAESVDAGQYLVPWMGDDRLMIDRSVPKLLRDYGD